MRRKVLNDDIKDARRQRVSAKAFRTRAGTLLCTSALARSANGEDGPRTRLGTRLDGFEEGRVLDSTITSIEELMERPRLHRVEEALLRLLSGSAA